MRTHRYSRLFGNMILILLVELIIGRDLVQAQDVLNIHKKIVLDQNKAFIASASDICVLEDESFVICDFKDQKILVYDQEGQYLTGWKKQGQGPGEYQGIWLTSYQAPYLAVADLRQPKILLYERTSKSDFKWIRDIPESGRTIKDFVLRDGELYFETAILHDERFYSVHIRDLDAKNDEYLFPAAVRYGGRPDDDYLKYYEAEFSKTWGRAYSFIDVIDGYIYSTWIGDLRIFKIDRKTKKWTDFGQKPKNYRPIKLDIRKPSAGLNAAQVFEHYRRESAKFSWIGGIFADHGFIGLLYITFADKESKWNVFLQLYDLDGVFTKEFMLPSVFPIERYLRSFYSRESGILYFLNMIDEDSKEIEFEIIQFKIKE